MPGLSATFALVVAAALGASVNSWTQGGLRVTDRPLDLAIQGHGYFIIQRPGGADGWAYTRYGSFSIDNDGYVVQKGTGLRLYGYADKACTDFRELNLAAFGHSLKTPDAVVKSLRTDLSGAITAVYEDGTTANAGFVALGLMSNPRRLERLSTHIFISTPDSGSVYFGPAQTQGRGSVYASTLEELDETYIYGPSLDP